MLLSPEDAAKIYAREIHESIALGVESRAIDLVLELMRSKDPMQFEMKAMQVVKGYNPEHS